MMTRVVITDTPMQRATRVTSVVFGAGERVEVSMLASCRAPDECPLNN